MRFRLTVAPDGSVVEATLLTGDSILADAAKVALTERRYEPVLQTERSSESQVETSICFLLTKEGALAFSIDDPNEEKEFAEALKTDPRKAGATPPHLLYAPDPSYTNEARRDRVQGVCVLELLIDETGSVHHPIVMKKLGDGLDENALAILKYWKFQPAIQDGKAIPVISTVEVAFHLN